MDSSAKFAEKYRNASDEALLRALRAGADSYQPAAWAAILKEADVRGLDAESGPPEGNGVERPEPQLPAISEEERTHRLLQAERLRQSGVAWMVGGVLASMATVMIGETRGILFSGAVFYGAIRLFRGFKAEWALRRK